MIKIGTRLLLDSVQHRVSSITAFRRIMKLHQSCLQRKAVASSVVRRMYAIRMLDARRLRDHPLNARATPILRYSEDRLVV